MTTPNNPSLDSQYLSEGQAARYLNVSVTALRCWRYEKRGPLYSKFGSLVRYHEPDLADFAKAGRREPPASVPIPIMADSDLDAENACFKECKRAGIPQVLIRRSETRGYI